MEEQGSRSRFEDFCGAQEEFPTISICQATVVKPYSEGNQNLTLSLSI